MVKSSSQRLQMPLQLSKIVGHPLASHFGHLKGHLNHIPVTVEPCTLPFLVAEEVGGVVVCLNGYRVHMRSFLFTPL